MDRSTRRFASRRVPCADRFDVRSAQRTLVRLKVYSIRRVKVPSRQTLSGL